MRNVKEIELAGKVCTIKLNNFAIATAEKQLGKSIMVVLQDGLGVEALHTLLYVGMKNYEPKLKMKEVYDLVDEAVEEKPEAYQELMELVLDLVLGALGLGAEEPEKKPTME